MRRRWRATPRPEFPSGAQPDIGRGVLPAGVATQLAGQADAFCGTVRVADWLDFAGRAALPSWPASATRMAAPDVHGANLGLSAVAYQAAGGFPALAAHEDRGVVDAPERAGYAIARKAIPAVITSARLDARARRGSGDYLLAIETAGINVQPCRHPRSLVPAGSSWVSTAPALLARSRQLSLLALPRGSGGRTPSLRRRPASASCRTGCGPSDRCSAMPRGRILTVWRVSQSTPEAEMLHP